MKGWISLRQGQRRKDFYRSALFFLRIAVILVLMVAFVPAPQIAQAAVSYVRVTEGTSTSTTLTLNIQSSGSDRVFVVGLAYKSNSPIAPTSIKWDPAGDNQDFTVERSAADGGDAQCFLYYLAAPTVKTSDVVITMPSSLRMVGYAALFNGVDQTNPFTAATAENQGTNDSPTVDVSSAADEYVIDIMAQVSAGPDTATATHTQICNGAATGGGTDTRGAGQYAVGQATRTMNWSMSDSDNWNIIAGALQEPSAVSAPTVTTQAATNVEDTTATGNGNITATGGENASRRGFEWDIDAGAPYANDVGEDGDFGTGAYSLGLTSLPTGTTIYYRAYATNSGGTGYGGEQTFLTKPAAPTNVVATDGDHTDKVVITWTKSTGATEYQVYRDGTPLGWIGDVATYDDTGADAPTITAGNTVATDGDSTAYVALSLSGTSANYGTTHTYKVRARNATGESADSDTDTGYRGVGSLTYQWQRSAADSDAGYSNIIGATSSTYNDTAAPAPTVTPGTATASDGASSLHITLSVSGELGNNGDGRYYQCVLNATGADEQTSAPDRGYRGIDTLTYQWYRSAADSDAGYSILGGATSDPYNDTTAPVPSVTPGTSDASDGTSSSYVTLTVSGETGSNGAGRYYYAVVSMSGAASGNTTHDRGYRGIDTLSYQWRRSSADADADFSNIAGATTDPYNDTGGVIEPDGRYYYAEVSMSGAATQDTTHDRGYMSAEAPSSPNTPTSFRLTRTGETTLEASWDPVSGVNNYWLMVSTIDYPDDPIGDFSLVYSENGTLIMLDGYDLDSIAFYFSLWSQVNPYSDNPAQAVIGGEALEDAVDNIATILQGMIMLLPIILLSILAFWRSNAIVFMITAGASLMIGLAWYNVYTTNAGLGVSLMLIAYGLLCLGLAFKYIFWREDILE